VEFELNGTKQTLIPIEADKDGLWFVFRGETYRQTTYGGGRFLTTDVPSNGLDHPGTVILDFNQAVNPPCAYSPFATCPLAPREARLPIAVPAGESATANDSGCAAGYSAGSGPPAVMPVDAARESYGLVPTAPFFSASEIGVTVGAAAPTISKTENAVGPLVA
jgi:hypothetical protein